MRKNKIVWWGFLVMFLFGFFLLSEGAELKFDLREKIDFEVKSFKRSPRYSHQCVPEVYGRIYINTFRDKSQFWERDICKNRTPILAVYKDGVLVEELDLQSLTLKSCDEQCYAILENQLICDINIYHDVVQAALDPGEHATFKVVIDPRNVAPEGKYQDGTMVESLENNNQIEVTWGCRDFEVVKESCPSSSALIFPGNKVSVSGKVSNYYDDPHTVIMFLFLSQDMVDSGDHPYSTTFKEDMRLAFTRLDLNPQSQRGFYLEGAIPKDTPPGKYYLGVSVVPGAASIKEANTQNDRFWCPITVQATAQQMLEEKAREGQIPKPEIEKAKKIAEAAAFDFVLRDVIITDSCKLQMKIVNTGRPMKDEDYNNNFVFLTIKERETFRFQNFTLSQVDPRRELKSKGEVEFVWPDKGSPSFTPGSQITVTINPQGSFPEFNKANNSATLNWACPAEKKQKDIKPTLPLKTR